MHLCAYITQDNMCFITIETAYAYHLFVLLLEVNITDECGRFYRVETFRHHVNESFKITQDNLYRLRLYSIFES